MELRNFIKTAGYSAAATVISPKIGESAIPDKNNGVAQQPAEYKSTVKVTDDKIVIDTISLTAAYESMLPTG